MGQELELTEDARILLEAEAAKKRSELGFFNRINSDEFPLLAEKEPQKLGIYQVEAIRASYYSLNNARQTVRGDQEAFSRISIEMGNQARLAAKIVKETFPKTEGSEEGISPIFWMNQEEKISFDNAVNFGFPEVINTISFPSLATVDQVNVLRFRLRAYDNAISDWSERQKESNSRLGMVSEAEAEKDLADLSGGMIVKLKAERRALVIQIKPQKSSRRK